MLAFLPLTIVLVFVLTTAATLVLFHFSIVNAQDVTTKKLSKSISFSFVIWLALQALLSLQGVYNSNTDSLPPKIMVFGILPALLIIALVFSTTQGRRFIDSLSLTNLAYLHLVRIPVELVLYGLFLHKAIPQIMTFEGQNFDIIAGVSAPFVAYFGLKPQKINVRFVLAWHLLSLGLLLNIVQLALRAAPSPLQQIAFDQPNIAILYFPFSWLPTFIVPLVLLSHLVSIRQLLKNRKQW